MDRALLIKHLAQANRHIAEGEQHIARLRELIAELERDGHDTRSANDLLDTFEQTQAIHISGRERVRAELAEAPAK